MKRVIISGINQLAIELYDLIDKDKCEVVAFLSNNSRSKFRYLKEVKVITLSDLIFTDYDFIIKTDKSIKIPTFNSIDFIEYIKKFYIRQLDDFFYNIEMKNKAFTNFKDIFCNFNVRVKINSSPIELLNLSIASENLKSEYEVAKQIIESGNGLNSKFGIIGLSCYSFDKKLCLTKSKHRVYNYYPFINVKNDKVISKNNLFEIMEKMIFKEEYKKELFKLVAQLNTDTFKEDITPWKIKKEDNASDRFVVNNLDDYYLEENENYLNILKKYINLFKSNGIEPIIVVAPNNNYKNFEIDKNDAFENLLYEIEVSENIQILNYLYASDFEDFDFYDDRYLNKKGADKFIEILGRDLSYIKNLQDYKEFKHLV